MPGSDLQGIQTGQLLVDDAPGQRLRRLPEQGIRSRSEQEELSATATLATPLVNLASEHPKDVRHALDFVQDHQPFDVELEIPSRVRETSRIAGTLQIEVQAVRRLRRDVAGERSLADLARTEECHGRCLLKVLQDSLLASTLEHSCQFNDYS